MRFDIRPANVPAVIGLQVVSGISANQVTWEAFGFTVAVYASQTNDRASATLLGQTSDTFFTHMFGAPATWFYWVRGVDSMGRETGVWNPTGATSGLQAISRLTTELEIAAGAVTAAKLAVDAITEVHISDGAITAAKTAIAGINASSGAITADTVATNWVYAGQVAATQINAGTLSAGVIYGGTIDANKINSGTLAAGVIYGGTINANKINSGTLAAGVIYSGSIATSQITAGTMTGSTIQTATSGARIVMSASTNKLQGYNSSGSSTVELGGTTGSVYATASASGVCALYGRSSLGSTAAVYGLSLSGHSGPAIQALSSANTSTGAHGIRGGNTNSNTAGLVGAANGYDFYAEGGGTNYGPFTGAHDALIQLGVTYAIGDIVVDVDCKARKSWSNTLFEIAPSSTANQRGTVGVVVREIGVLAEQYLPAAFNTPEIAVDDYGNAITVMDAAYAAVKDTHRLVVMNALGEGQMNVCGEGGNLMAGDLIVSSSIPGKGMKQADDIVRGYTVAKSREAVEFDSPTQVKQVACIYLCG